MPCARRDPCSKSPRTRVGGPLLTRCSLSPRALLCTDRALVQSGGLGLGAPEGDNTAIVGDSVWVCTHKQQTLPEDSNRNTTSVPHCSRGSGHVTSCHKRNGRSKGLIQLRTSSAANGSLCLSHDSEGCADISRNCVHTTHTLGRPP